MTKRVLDIGNCGPDHGAITHMIQTHFDAQVDAAHAAADALPLLEQHDYDLILVNRLLDVDGTPGLDVLAELQRSPRADVPVMLITNFAEHQQTAVAAGAVQGFGKNAIGAPQTIELLGNYLQ